MANPAEVVLLHIGTNDISRKDSASTIVHEIAQTLNETDRYETLSRSSVTVILAQIINRGDPQEARSADTTSLNGSIASMAAARIEAGERLLVANLESALSYPADIFFDDFPV